MTETSGSSGSFLTGIRVLELADELGEYCGKVLAGLGADVIKVEPLGGEATRTYGPFYGDRRDPNRSLYFWHYNFGKRSVTLDLESESGRAEFLRLAESVDIVLDTRHRLYLKERGLGYEQLKLKNPGLIYVRISPFGDDGPWADYKGSDLVHLALGGIMMNCGYDPTPDGEYETPPIAPQMWQSYHIAGEVTAIAAIGALCYRLQSGQGQQLSTSVHEAVSKNTETDFPDWVYLRLPHNRLTARHSFPKSEDADNKLPSTPGNAMTKDGRWVLPYETYLSGTGAPIENLFALLERHGMGAEVSDPRFRDTEFLRSREGVREVATLVGQLIGGYTFDRDVWLEAQDAGLPWAPVRRPEENVGDPHWAQRETFFEVDHPEVGRAFTEVGAKWMSPGLPWRRGPRAPMIGEHNAEILGAHETAQRSLPTPTHRAHAAPLSPFNKPWALAGVRVIDLGWILASAGGGRFLASLGAEVIKVEHSSKIDMMRMNGTIAPAGLRTERDAATGPLKPHPTSSLNRCGGFMEVNAGKRAISLNLKDPKGKEILKELLKDADAIVEGYSPGTLERMGLGYDVLRELNPRLVYVQQSGMGQNGLYGRLKSFGPTAQALSGITELSGLPAPYPPAGIGYSYLDWFGAYQIALATLSGLYRQKITGEGCWIDSSQVESGIYLTGTTVLDHAANGEAWKRSGNRSPNKCAAPHGAYRVLGVDRWIALSAFTQEEWLAVTRVLQTPEWANDGRFVTLERRLENQDSLDALIEQATQKWDGVALMEALQAAGVAAGICETAEDRCEWDPQLRHLQWVMELPQSEIGTWRTKTAPTHYSETPAYQGGLVNRHAPSYGEDNEFVYGQLLGMSNDDIAALADAGVI